MLFIYVMAAFFLLLIRLAYLQFFVGGELQAKAEQLRTRNVQVEAKRGAIFDRNGKKLAVSISADSVYALPPAVKLSGQASQIAQQLAPILGLPAEQILQKITSDHSFQWLQRKLDFAKSEQVKKLDLPGIKLIAESQRFYPNDLLASHILGFAGVDNQGLDGIEKTHDQDLKGVPGEIVIEYDAQGRELPETVHSYNPPVDGNSLVLTIDETIQHFAERELDKIMASDATPKGATILVMKPQTGEILALANRPNYDPNHYAAFDPQTWRDIAVTNTYEPGSTFKIVTMSAAIEEGVVTPADRFYDPGYIVIGKNRIKCWRSYNPHGSESFAEGVQNSCNPVFVEIAQRLEAKQKGLFYKYINAFGMGKKTGIDLPGEAYGLMIKEKNLIPLDIGTISIGQSISVTPVQILTAACAVANGGMLMEPQIVREVVNQQNQVIKKFQPKPIRRVVSEQTAATVRSLLEGVVAEGTGRNAYIEGFRVGGKTGTAQKAGAGGYQAGKYIVSFLGMAPSNDPQVCMLVIIDEPQGPAIFGGTLAAPPFRAVMEDTLRYLGVVSQIPPTEKAEEKPVLVKKVHLPVLLNLSADQAKKVLAVAGFAAKTSGSGSVVTGQDPGGMALLPEGSTVKLIMGKPGKDGAAGLVTMPDLTGNRIFTVSAYLTAMGLKLSPSGTGTAQEQHPVPGTKVKPGTVISVKFAEAGSAAPVTGP